MTWASFVEYCRLEEDGKPDATMRGYDLAYLNGSLPGKVFDRACKRMGLSQETTVRHHLIGILRQMMINVGLYAPDNDDELMLLARKWYNWDRILKGDVVKWQVKQYDPMSLI